MFEKTKIDKGSNPSAHPFVGPFEWWSSTDVWTDVCPRVLTDCVRRMFAVGASMDPLEDEDGVRTLSNSWLDGGETSGEGERRIDRVGERLLMEAWGEAHGDRSIGVAYDGDEVGDSLNEDTGDS